MGKLTVRARVFQGDGLFDFRDIVATGRYAQTLKALIDAGDKGVTALEISSWALRLSHYIDVLRKDSRYLLNIHTELEEHEFQGMGAGRHARYRILDRVELINAGQEAA